MRTQKTSLPQDQIFHLHWRSDMFEDLVDLRYTVCFIRPDLDLDRFQGIVLDGERRGPSVLK